MLKIASFVVLMLFSIGTAEVIADGNEASRAINIVKVEIYYYGWHVETRSALTPSMVRSIYWSKTVIRDESEVQRFVRWLRLGEMKKMGMKSDRDVRVVIDLFDKKGQRLTYCATIFEIFSEDGEWVKMVDDNFKSKFTF
ncbi:MAG: hypothetical protein OEV94_02345 [Deltaproteobacteria bacterium]|nr:hypothetical protein [Deltaproteobacteria bacterium]